MGVHKFLKDIKGIDQLPGTLENLLVNLNKIRRHLCAYQPPHSDSFCDCKYGADNIGSKSEKGNGCPEIRLAMDVVRAYMELVKTLREAGLKELKRQKGKPKRKKKFVEPDFNTYGE
jgi:hypothetical protein